MYCLKDGYRSVIIFKMPVLILDMPNTTVCVLTDDITSYKASILMKMGFITSYTGKSHLTRDILWLTWPKRHELLMSVLIKVTLHYQKRRCGRAIHNGHIELIFLQ